MQFKSLTPPNSESINMTAILNICVVLYTLFLLPYHCLSFPLCTNSRLPSKLEVPLEFCQYKGNTCCDSAEDTQLQKTFEALNVSDHHCASLLQSVLCAKCDQYSSELFNIGSSQRRAPILCSSAVSVKSNQAKADASNDFCTEVWDRCGNLSTYNSPFSQLTGQETYSNSSPTKLTERWPSKNDFCKAFGGSPDTTMVCFNGKTTSFSSEDPTPIQGICLEKIGSGSYVSMAAHPDGSDHIFLTSQQGKIFLASVPKGGSNGILDINESQPFLDISDQVLFQGELGLLSTAFHPNFNQNGRFFISFNCDKLQHPECSGRCSCNTDMNCDPAGFGNVDGILPCQYHNVVAEFSANSSSTASKFTLAEKANPSEVTRIFTMGLPFHSHHAGQILFGPADGYLYHVVADISHTEDSYSFAQNKKSVHGKILRFDVDKIPSVEEWNDKNLWGNYSIPKDNPYIEDTELLPEIWALGLRNPWRCSFDSERPSYFLCGDAGQALFEEVDIVTKGGNYGWPIYEGPFLYNRTHSQGGNIPLTSLNPIFPVMGYNDSKVVSGSAAVSINGGYFYRSRTDPCLYGRYLYADVFAQTIWAGTEQPENSGNFTSMKIPVKCAKNSPLECNTKPGSSDAAIGYAFSFGEDNRKDIYILASSGVYRIAHPSRCDFSCSKANQSSHVSQGPRSSSSSSACKRTIFIMDYLTHLLVTCAGYMLLSCTLYN